MGNKRFFGSSFSSDKDYSDYATVVERATAGLDELSDDWGFISYPSTPVTQIDIPEVLTVEANFTYNYYTKNERTSGAGVFAVLDINNLTQEDEFIKKADRFPRYNRVYIQPTTFKHEDRYLKGLASTLGRRAIQDNLSNLQYEEAISTANFSAIRLKDDFIDDEFYNSLSASISFFGLSQETSGNQQSTELENELSGSTFTTAGSKIRSSLSNVQSQGVAYAPTDTRKETSDNAFTSVRDLDYSAMINNKVVKNIIQASIEDKSNIYENELRSVLEAAESIQDSAVADSVPGEISSDEFELSIGGAIDMIVLDAETTKDMQGDIDNAVEMNESSYPIGFIIEKIELARDGDNVERIEHEPMIIEGYRPINLLDKDVRYGGTYIYRVRTIALTRIEMLRRDDSDEVEDQIVMAVVMVASSGRSTKVDCVETIPPNPPQNLRFHWDYQERSLILFWEEELNPQRDVIRYQILKRKSIHVPFTLIKEFDFDQSTSKVAPLEKVPKRKIRKMPSPRKFFRDKSFKKTESWIYTLAAVDARGFSSNYSSQFKVRFDVSRNKLEVDVISRSGAPKPYPNLYLNQDLFADTMKDSGHSRMRIFFDPEYYEVFKTNVIKTRRKKKPAVIKNTVFLDLIADSYKLQIINVDSQLSEVIEISISDDSGDMLEIPITDSTLLTIS